MRAIRANVKKHIWAYAFITPMLILFLGFTLYPLLASLRDTFFYWTAFGLPKVFVGFRNYIELASDPFFWNAFKNTCIYAAALVPTQLALALGLAAILNSRWLKLKYLFRAVFFSPVVTSTAIIGIVMNLIVITLGHPINLVLIDIGLVQSPVDWLGNPHTALWLVIGVGIWATLGYPIIYLLSGLQAVRPELYDAAKADGAGTLSVFRHITIPSIQPILMVVLIMMVLYSLRVFDIVQVMTRGGPYFATDVVSTYIYRYAFYSASEIERGANLGYASAAAFLLGILVMTITAIGLLAARHALKRRDRDSSR